MINKIRLNGITLAENSFDIRSTIYLNSVQAFTWLNFIIYSAIIVFCQNNPVPFVTITFIGIHACYLLVFLWTRFVGYKHARHIFLLTAYGMISFGDHILGKYNFNQVFYFAFMPTPFILFSFLNEKKYIAFYSVLVFLLVFLPEVITYNYVQPITWAKNNEQFVRAMNMISGFVLCASYAGFVMYNTVRRQGKLITQSSSLQSTLDNAMAAIWSINKDYEVLAINQMFKNFAKSIFSNVEVKVGTNIKPLIYSSRVPAKLQQHYNDVLNGVVVNDEIFFNNQYYEVRSIPLITDENEIVGATFSARNITDFKKSSAELLLAKENAEKATMARTMFLSNMSHELRTPLNGLAGLTNIMLAETAKDDTQYKNLEIMHGLNNHMVAIINNILDYTKIESGKAELNIEPFNLQAKIDKISEIFELPAQQKNIVFKTIVTGNANIDLLTDRTKINQVFINLISNAIKFTTNGGVTFKIEILEDTPAITKIRFTIADTGIGIKQENLSKIFESFTQADKDTTRLFGGTGLGLTIADKNLKLFGWHLNVESAQNIGTTFWFDATFKKAYQPATKQNTTPQYEPLPNLSILIAEDNLINQMVAKKIIQNWGAQVSIANNGQEALTIAINTHIDVVLMDLDMPVMDGYQATEAILAKKPTLPIIALTAATIENVEDELLAKGFTNFVQKPFVPQNLYNTIKNSAVKN
jgi:signal transduction histidine kinase